MSYCLFVNDFTYICYMEFYYKNEISGFTPKCPPEDYLAIDRESYRWVFDTMEHENNFKAQAEKNPKMLNSKDDVGKCASYALSFHRSLQESHDHFDYLVKRFCAKDKDLAYTRFGTNVATGMLNSNDGVSGMVEDNGHFNFHHVKDHKFASNFKIKEPL
jgi:hypothetical protein